MMLTICAGIAAGAPAAAQDEPGDVTEYTFPDEHLVGEIVGPGGTGITVGPKGESRSLIRVRGHFVREMIRSVEEI